MWKQTYWFSQTEIVGNWKWKTSIEAEREWESNGSLKCKLLAQAMGGFHTNRRARVLIILQQQRVNQRRINWLREIRERERERERFTGLIEWCVWVREREWELYSDWKRRSIIKVQSFLVGEEGFFLMGWARLGFVQIGPIRKLASIFTRTRPKSLVS